MTWPRRAGWKLSRSVARVAAAGLRWSSLKWPAGAMPYQRSKCCDLLNAALEVGDLVVLHAELHALPAVAAEQVDMCVGRQPGLEQRVGTRRLPALARSG